ncbi:hypothetical protein PINS_up007407 [Pythium insidiosum]|nr:hypothetical protein PINS_up007407 [Pythium insidiosum]
MKLQTLLALSALGLVSVSASSPRVNGWFPCAESDDGDKGAPNGTLASLARFECAQVEVPLCYDGVCDSDATIELFVKRRLAKHTLADGHARAVIWVSGGPGQPSPVEEGSFDRFYDALNASVDMYTMDHRGTGRSEFLECEASQAMTGGSPEGIDVTSEEMINCVRDLSVKYDGNAAAFSVTSAARDIQTVIETFVPKHKVFVNGASYGTFLAQRVMQLKLPQVVGYIYDGVDVLTTEKDPFESANSHGNQAILGVSTRFFQYCYDAKNCPMTFKSRDTVLEEVMALFAKLDDETDSNACSKLLMSLFDVEDKPSRALRPWLGGMAGKAESRVDVYAFLGHLQTCSEEDQSSIKKLFAKAQGGAEDEDDDDHATKEDDSDGDNDADDADAAADDDENTGKYASPDRVKLDSGLLYNVVAYSERWHRPTPTTAEFMSFFESGPFTGNFSGEQIGYCIFSGFHDAGCAEFVTASEDTKAASFQYDVDKYFEAPMVLPDHASALIFNGGLDFATPVEFGELLYDKVKDSGRGAMMVTFDFGGHVSGESVAGNPTSACHDAIWKAFVLSDGAIESIDTWCMSELPVMAFSADSEPADDSEGTVG